MPNPEKGPSPEEIQGKTDSLNCDDFEPTNVIEDNTIRPMREEIRKRLKWPFNRQPPPTQPPQEPPPEKE